MDNRADKISQKPCPGRILRLPDYLKTPIASLDNAENKKVSDILKRYKLNTVCKSARCPNKTQCWSALTATFMIMGNVCTRNCRFCNIEQRQVQPLDPDEPKNIAAAVYELGIKYAVITSVTRDDLPDGGSGHFRQTVEEIRTKNPDTKIELLVPDFKGFQPSLDTVIEARPNVFNHNVETVPSLYLSVRPMAEYRRSLEVLMYVKNKNPEIITKTGLMVGLGETYDELFSTFCDIKNSGVDILTIGQYIRPSKAHFPVNRYYAKEEFEKLDVLAKEAGLKHVVSAPLARSSYKAFETYEKAVAEKARG